MTPRTALIRTSEAPRTIGVTRSALRAWAPAGIGPAPDRLGRYDRTALTDWAREMSAAVSMMGRC